ncbi:MAG: hypothetical protein K940chlam5_00741 [Candidatus Anoxychlamydiales bacterium]|nr:hypothetical protein [Candidatus Anoxychlamydiales bacterium]
MVKKVPNSNEEYSKLLTSQNNLLEHARKLENCNIKRVTQKFIILSPTTAQELLSFYVENTGDEKLSYIPLIFSSKSVLADLTIEDNLGNCLLPPSDKVDKMVCIWILDKIIGLVYPLRMKVKYIKPILSSFWEGKVEEKIKQMIKNIIEDNLIIKESFKSSKSFDKIKSDSERYLYDLLKKKGLINSNKKKNKFNEDLYKYIKENNQLLEKVLVAINKKAFIVFVTPSKPIEKGGSREIKLSRTIGITKEFGILHKTYLILPIYYPIKMWIPYGKNPTFHYQVNLPEGVIFASNKKYKNKIIKEIEFSALHKSNEKENDFSRNYKEDKCIPCSLFYKHLKLERKDAKLTKRIFKYDSEDIRVIFEQDYNVNYLHKTKNQNNNPIEPQPQKQRNSQNKDTPALDNKNQKQYYSPHFIKYRVKIENTLDYNIFYVFGVILLLVLNIITFYLCFTNYSLADILYSGFGGTVSVLLLTMLFAIISDYSKRNRLEKWIVKREIAFIFLMFLLLMIQIILSILFGDQLYYGIRLLFSFILKF